MNEQEEIESLAILIRDLRKHRKVTLNDLAERIGRSVGFLSQVERGLSRPTVADLTAIGEALGVPTTYFYSLSKPRSVPWVTRPDERRTVYYAAGITDILVSPNMHSRFSILESHLGPGQQRRAAGRRQRRAGRLRARRRTDDLDRRRRHAGHARSERCIPASRAQAVPLREPD